MSNATLVVEPPARQRFLGAHSAGQPGPTVIVLAGIHGNEPAGIHAFRRILARLQRERLPFRGRIAGAAGNLGALAEGKRFVNRDLNRQWLSTNIDRLRRQDPALDHDEDREQRELLAFFDEQCGTATGPVVFIDLHSTSSEGPPFCCLADTLPNRMIAFSLEMPVILGLEETIDGAVLEYFNERGLVGVTIEGGQHDRPATVDHHEAALWLALLAAGSLPAGGLPDEARLRDVLRAGSDGMPHIVEIREHHKIKPADQFEMRPGYQSFQPVRKGEVLARDRLGDVKALERGRILMPLYQKLGEDGYFLVRDVRPFWLHVARWLRNLRLDALLPLMPGIRRHPNRRNVLLVDPKVARWLVLEVFHLLGYRRCRADGDHLVFTKRRVAPAARRLPWRG